MINPDRVYRMWQAQRKARALNGFSQSPAFVVARRFGITCAEVRQHVQRVRESRKETQ